MHLFETIITKVSNPILVVDQRQRIVFANSAWCSLMGRALEDCVGTPVQEVFHNPNGQWQAFLTEVSLFLQGQKTSPVRSERENPSFCRSVRDPLVSGVSTGDERVASSVVTLGQRMFSYEIFDVRENLDTRLGAGVVFNDLTIEKDFLDRMMQAENIASLKTLVAGISHEVSNPLHSIITFAEALLKETDQEKINSHALKIVDNSRRLASVVSRLSGTVQKKGEGMKENVDLAESFLKALDFALLPYQESEIELDINLSVSFAVPGDPEEIQQVFVNVINNAFQAMAGKGRLTVSSHQPDDFFCIVIEDSGCGIPKEIQRKIFNPFFTTKMQGEGTGLGLSITHRLMEKYKGYVKVDSQEGHGTRVTLAFCNPKS